MIIWLEEKMMEQLKVQLDKPDIKYWPEVRWFMAEGLHTDQTLKKSIRMLYDAGFGATEFLALPDEGANDERYGWGSEEFVHDSHVIVEETTKRGMGASFTSGAHWATANLVTILPDDKAASKELSFTVEMVAPGQTRRGLLSKPGISMPAVTELILVAVIAGKRLGSTQIGAALDKDSLIVLTDKVTGERDLTWTAPNDGIYDLMTFWMHGTGQTSEPAKGKAYTINYVDRYGVDALIDYWDKVILTPELRENIKKNGRIQMYMDSLELQTYGNGGQFWGYTMLDEFKKRRGYDFTPYLPYAMRLSESIFPKTGLPRHYYESQDAEFTKKIRHDLYQVQTELYIENMLKPFKEWLNKNGIGLRAEISYGMPYEISIPGKYVDYIETETLEFASQLDAYRNLAGPAFLFNKLYSSETGAAKLNYMKGLPFYTQLILTQYAAGVSRTVLHGFSAIEGSESATHWPGHEGMDLAISERFSERQPSWRHYRDWTEVQSRFQFLLRQGMPKRDLAILRLDYHFNNHMAYYNGITHDVIYETMLMRANKGIYWQDMTLQNSGYTYDYFAPQLLEDDDVCFRNGVINPDGPAYRAVIVYQEDMPLSSAKRLLEWAKRGLKVLIVNGVAEMIRNEYYVTHINAASKTPYNDGGDAELTKVVAELKALPCVKELSSDKDTCAALQELGVKARSPFAEPNKKILTFTRADDNKRYLYLYNYMYTESESFTFTVGIEGEGQPYLVDCWANKVTAIGKYEIANGYTNVELTLAPGEAVFVVLDCNAEGAVHAVSGNGTVIRCGDVLKMVACKSGNYTVKLNNGLEIEKDIQVPDPICIPEWDIIVEDWNEGEKKIVEEDRGLGYVTREVYFETKKTKIDLGKTTLKPWKEYEAVGPEVSGLGCYTAVFTLPQGWNDANGAVLKIGSTNDNSVAVYVNGKKTPPVDTSKLTVDITEFLSLGENTVYIEIGSTLNNRMLQRKFYDNIALRPDILFDGKPMMMSHKVVTVQSYGLTGKTSICFYTKAVI
jgi:hypothetical protein